jgi:hypothetical protein
LSGASAEAAGSLANRLSATPVARVTLLLLAAGLNTLLFFRETIFAGFARVDADQWDGRLMTANLEHWRHVWLLEAHWRSPIFFHPTPGVLGYSDAYVLSGTFYAAFRALGADWFVSYELVDIAFKLIGFFSFFHLCHNVLGVRLGYAILGASLFFQLHSTAQQLGHGQLLSVGLAPLQLMLLYRFFAALAEASQRRVFLLGAASLALYAAWAMTGFYMAWYFVLYATCVALVYLAIAGPRRWRNLGEMAGRHRWALALLIPVAVLVAAPFVATYLPTVRDTGMHSLVAVRSFTGTPWDIIDVGDGNLVYGRISDRIHRWFTGEPWAGGERATGFTLLLLVLYLLGWAWCWRHSIGLDRLLVRTMLVVLGVLWLATFRFKGFLGWEYIYAYFPGGAATRVPPRFQIFVGVFVILVATLFFDRSRWFDRPALFVVLALLLLAEQVHRAEGWGVRRAEQAWVFTEIPEPPAVCRAFFVLRPRPRPDNDAFYSHSVDAMMVAERFNLPTLNGLQTFIPKGADLFGWSEPDYLDRVLAYARRSGVMDGLCGLDIPTLRWQTVPAP